MVAERMRIYRFNLRLDIGIVGTEPRLRGIDAQRARIAEAREVDAVELVEEEPAGNGAALDPAGSRRQLFRAGAQRGVQRAGLHAHPQLAVLGELAAQVQRYVKAAQVIGGQAGAALEHIDRTALQLDARGDEEILARVQRLVELAHQRGGLAHLGIGAPFGAERIQPGAAVAADQVEEGIAAEVRTEPETEAQIVRPIRFLDRIDHQDALARLFHDAVVDVLEVAGAEQPPHVLVERGLVERLARLGLHHRRGNLGVDAVQRRHLDRIDRPRVGRRHRLLRRAQLRILRRRQCQRREAIGHLACRGFADGDGGGQVVEVGRGKVAERGLDQDVGRAQRGQRGAHVLLGQDVEHLARHADDRGQLLALHQRRAEVDGDDDIGAHRARHADRQVVGEPAVDQQFSFVFRRCHRARHRHAGAHHVGQLAGVEHYRRAGDQVGGDGAVRDRQLVEVAVAGRARQLAQHRFQLHARDRALGQQQPARLHADLGREQVGEVILLAADGQVLARRAFLEQLFGAQPADQPLHLGGRHAGGIGAAHQRAHAGACDAVHRHAQVLEHLEHADMRGAARTAAGQHQADARTRAAGRRGGGGGRVGRCGRCGHDRWRRYGR
ncbi:hypothetical protein D9M72_296590 [compost metagenome]